MAGQIVLTTASAGSLTLTPADTGNTFVSTIPARTGNISVDGPAFSAYLSTNQTISASTWTKVAFDTKLFDTNTNFSTSTNRFTPTIAGYYQINACVFLSGSGINGYIAIYKNGILIFYGNSYPTGSGSSNPILTCASLVQMNGSTDYIEIYTYSGGTVINGISTVTYVNGFLARAA
jgi:hypothetical protein